MNSTPGSGKPLRGIKKIGKREILPNIESGDENEKKKRLKLKNLAENIQPIQTKKFKIEKEKHETTKEIETLQGEISQLLTTIDLPKLNFNENYYKICKKAKLKRITIYDIMDQVQIYCKENRPDEPNLVKNIADKIYEKHKNKHKGLFEIQLKTVSKKSKLSLQKKKEEFIKI